MRVDTTVVQTDIHHPTDNTLLWDVVRVVTRLICFFFNDPATTEIYTLSLHDALPICATNRPSAPINHPFSGSLPTRVPDIVRSEEHTSELQSPYDLVCRLLLEKKKKQKLNFLNTYKKKQKTQQHK